MWCHRLCSAANTRQRSTCRRYASRRNQMGSRWQSGRPTLWSRRSAAAHLARTWNSNPNHFRASATMSPMRNAIPIYVGASRADMGRQAAYDVASELRRRLARQHRVRMIFAAAPSQSPMLEALIPEPGIDWGRVSAFHMDEYLDLPEGAPQHFGAWLSRALFDRLPFAEVHLLSAGDDPSRSADAYAR